MLGSFLVKGLDEQDSMTCTREKYVYFTYIGTAVPELERAKFNFNKSSLSRFFGGMALALDFRSMDLFTEGEIGPKLIQAGAAHKPTHYDFGGGNVIPIASLVDADSESEDEDFD